MGARLRVINEDVTLSKAEKVKRMEELQIQMDASYSSKFKQYIDDENLNIRKFSVSKNLKEDIFSTENLGLINAANEQREFVWTTTGTPVKQLLLNSKSFQEAQINGDPLQCSLAMQQAIQAVKMGDKQEAYNLGLDKDFIDGLIKFKENGRNDYLDQVVNIAKADAAFLGCVDQTMGGESITGTRSALTNVNRVAWTKKIEEYIDKKISMSGADEARALAVITDGLSELKNMMRGKNWEEIFESGNLVTPNGKTIRNREEMEEAIREITTNIQAGKEKADSYALKAFKDVLAKAIDDHPGDYNFANEMNKISSIFSAGETVFNASGDQNVLYTEKASIGASIDEFWKKLSNQK